MRKLSVLAMSVVLLGMSSSSFAKGYECQVREKVDADTAVLDQLRNGDIGDAFISQFTLGLLNYRNLIRKTNFDLNLNDALDIDVSDKISNEEVRYNIKLSEINDAGSAILSVEYPEGGFSSVLEEYEISGEELEDSFRVERVVKETNMNGGYVSFNDLGITRFETTQSIECEKK